MCCRVIYVAVLLYTILSLVSADGSSNTECTNTQVPTVKTLKKKILCNYDREVAPVNQTTRTVEVLYVVLAEFFEFDEYSNLLMIRGDIMMDWTDLALGWNKKDFKGIDSISLSSKDIWVPEINLYTYSIVGYENSLPPGSSCIIEADGAVSCAIPIQFMAHCNPDVRRWPFDSHKCNVSVASMLNEVIFDRSSHITLSTMPDLSDKYWKLVTSNHWFEISSGIDDMKHPKIIFSFVFERHSGYLIAIFFIPSIVMLMVTLSTFCLDPEGAARMFVICANITCHCLFLMYLAWYLPANGDKTPVVAIFFRDSFILVWVSLVITVCAGKMRKAARAPPAWVTSFADSVQESPAQYLLFNGLYTKSDAEDEGESDTVAAVMASSASNKWRRIATLLDRISLIVFATIVTVLSCAFLP